MKRWLLTLLAGALIVRTFQEWKEQRAEKRAERKKLAELLTVVRRGHESGEGGFVQRFRRNER